MADTDEEKEFEPTPQKLLEARKKGEVAKSNDLNAAAAYLGFMACTAFLFGDVISNLGDLFVTTIEMSSFAGRLTDTAGATGVLSDMVWEVMRLLMPIFLVPAAFVATSIIVQRSFTVAPEKIQFKLNRISPIEGAKNKYGRAGLFEFVKSSTKLALFMSVLAIFIWINFDTIAMASQLSPGAALVNMGALMTSFLAVIFSLAFIVGLIDFSFQRAEHLRKNRMSRKDLMDEIKNAEGDPLLKQRRRQKALALSAGQMAEVPNASVVMVNPTHYAVALRWDPAAASAPIVLAKGTDEIALRIRAIATETGVPVHSDPPATRALHGVAEVGDPVPPDQYEAVAAAIRFAEDLRQKRARSFG